MLSCNSQEISKKASDKNANKLYLDAEIVEWKQIKTSNYLIIHTSLINNTSSLIKFINMYCDWEIAYEVDTKFLEILPKECDKNFPELNYLTNQQKYERDVPAKALVDTNEIKGLKFRIGFKYVTAANQEEAHSKSYELYKSKNIIWSDTLQIK